MLRKLNVGFLNKLVCARLVSVPSNNFSTKPENATTHFGYETIETKDKTDKVHKVFREVAAKYDLMNDAMSLGIHRVWKDIFIYKLYPTLGTKLLDVAGGTGDIAFRYIDYLRKSQQSTNEKSNSKSSVTILDINQNMLDVGMERAERLGYTSNDSISVDWVCDNAEKLPFDDNQFTAYTIAFGIRNVTHIDEALKEAHRVLKPGGRFMCLEFSHIENSKLLQWIYDQYSFQVIPPMGQILASNWDAYKYLVESIRKFPKQHEFKTMIQNAGFKCVHYENLTFGVCAIHSGIKL